MLNSDQYVDRWLVPDASVSVTGLVIDDNAVTLPPVLKKYRLMAFWDSIGEGTHAPAHAPAPAHTCTRSRMHAFCNPTLLALARK